MLFRHLQQYPIFLKLGLVIPIAYNQLIMLITYIHLVSYTTTQETYFLNFVIFSLS
jgi:hypothetical protein